MDDTRNRKLNITEGTQKSIASGNLEQAYEDLEKEIRDIKSKL
jgi:hypothetical protein